MYGLSRAANPFLEVVLQSGTIIQDGCQNIHCGLITTVLLQDFFQSGAKTYQELSEYLKAVREHPVGRLWVDCLIKPPLLALQLLRAQRDGDFLLQQVSLEAMMLYFFAAGLHNLVSEER